MLLGTELIPVRPAVCEDTQVNYTVGEHGLGSVSYYTEESMKRCCCYLAMDYAGHLLKFNQDDHAACSKGSHTALLQSTQAVS